MTVTMISLWCNAIPDACPRCGAACCSGSEGEPGEVFFCAGRCDANGHHHGGGGEVYNNEPCWHSGAAEAQGGEET